MNHESTRLRKAMENDTPEFATARTSTRRSNDQDGVRGDLRK